MVQRSLYYSKQFFFTFFFDKLGQWDISIFVIVEDGAQLGQPNMRVKEGGVLRCYQVIFIVVAILIRASQQERSQPQA